MENNFIKNLFSKIRYFYKTIEEAHKQALTDKIEFELKELENIFTLLIFGAFTGIPSPPSFITLELLPFMERELTIMLNSSHDAKDILATLAGTLDGM